MNKIIIIGNLCADPDLRQTDNLVPTMNCRLAVQRKSKGPDGLHAVDFFAVVLWRKTAEYVALFAKKGDKIAIEGSMQHRDYTAGDGSRRDVWEVIADRAEIVHTQTPINPAAEPARTTQKTGEFEEVDDDELPF